TASARECLPRHDIAVTDGQAGDEGKIDRVTDRPAFQKANQKAKNEFDHQDGRQDRPSDMVPSATRKRRRTFFGAARFISPLKSFDQLPVKTLISASDGLGD